MTVCIRTADVLPAKLASPAYRAVIECAPAINAVPAVVNCADPPDKFPVPSCVVPSRKVTVPVGELPEAGCTVVVNVTLCPYVDGFRLELTAVEVTALFTVCAKTPDVLPARFAFPPYDAVME